MNVLVLAATSVILDKTLLTTLVSVGTSIITVLFLKPFVDRKLHKYQLNQNFISEQSKKVKDVLAVYKGRLLKSGELLNSRLKNYAKNHDKNWLDVNGDFINEHHYIDTTVYRFLSFYAYIKLIETKLIFLDTTISQEADLRLIKYFRLFHNVMCDVDLFEGHSYDYMHGKDHFFTSPFENFSNYVIKDDDVINLDMFVEKKSNGIAEIKKVYEFFDGMKTSEPRLRVERVKILHLVLIAFLNEYGYDYQRTPSSKLDFLKGQLGEYKLIDNLKKVIKKYKLQKALSDDLNKVVSRVS